MPYAPPPNFRGDPLGVRVRAQDQRFPLERGGPPISSEPGTLFVDISAPQAVGSDGTIAREILEIRCAD